jgi:hypothetical protein
MSVVSIIHQAPVRSTCASFGMEREEGMLRERNKRDGKTIWQKGGKGLRYKRNKERMKEIIFLI